MIKFKGKFKYKGIKKTDAGSFINEKGETINYDASYKIQVDEITDNGIKERSLKFPATNETLFQKLVTCKPYEDIELEFVLEFNTTGCKATPIDLIQNNK